MDMNLKGIKKKVQLEITLRCNHCCANCNRMVGICTPPNSDMKMAQIEKFIDQTICRFNRLGVPLETIHLIGGEPLIHPDFLCIYHLIKDRLQVPGYVARIEIYTNGRLPIPKEIEGITIVVPPEIKMHGHFYMSPADLGVAVHNCGAPDNCGIAVNAFGYFPCGAGCSIVRLLGIPGQVFYDFPDKLDVWDYNLVCPHCVHAIVGILANHAVPAVSDPRKVPVSKIFREKLDSWQAVEMKRL